MAAMTQMSHCTFVKGGSFVEIELVMVSPQATLLTTFALPVPAA